MYTQGAVSLAFCSLNLLDGYDSFGALLDSGCEGVGLGWAWIKRLVMVYG